MSSQKDDLASKMGELRALMESNPAFAEFSSTNKQSSTPDGLMKAQVDRLEEIKRREATLRRLHGLKEGEVVEKNQFGDDFLTLVSATAPQTGVDPSQFVTPVQSLQSLQPHRPSIQEASAATEPSLPRYSRDESGGGDKDDKDLPAEAFREWDDSEHQFFLLNIAHRAQRPLCEVPSMRILPAFATMAECVEQGKSIHGAVHDATVWAYRLHEPIPLCRSTESQCDAAYTASKVAMLQKLHDMHAVAIKKDYDANVAQRQTGKQNMSLQKKLQKKKEDSVNNPRVKLLNARMEQRLKDDHVPEAGKKFPRDLEDRYQRFAVIRVLQDIEPSVLKNMREDEPVIMVDGFFESEIGARYWMRKTASKYVQKENMVVVDMYAWLFPTLVDPTKISEEYRNSEQNTIMSQKKKEKDRVQNFTAWQEANNQLKALEEAASAGAAGAADGSVVALDAPGEEQVARDV